MKHFSYYFFHTCLFFVFIICSMSLTACRTMRTSEKAVSESETASVTESRLTFYRTIDSLSRQFNMAADSIILIFPNTARPEFPTAFPSRIEGCAETPSDTSKFFSSSISSPSGHKQVKVYGLHVTGVSDKKSVVNADLKDSVTVATQSKMDKSASKQSSDPSKVPKWICLCMVMVILLYILYKIR